MHEATRTRACAPGRVRPCGDGLSLKGGRNPEGSREAEAALSRRVPAREELMLRLHAKAGAIPPVGSGRVELIARLNEA